MIEKAIKDYIELKGFKQVGNLYVTIYQFNELFLYFGIGFILLKNEIISFSDPDLISKIDEYVKTSHYYSAL